MPNNKPHISVVSPVYGCAQSLPELYDRCKKAISPITDNFEIILVNDGSPDMAWNTITQLAETDNRVVGINLSRNFGQHYAITAGLDYAAGDWVVSSVSNYYFRSSISIVPLFHGSGTRLKIPEAMAHGVPVVSTSKGAEGNNYIQNRNILFADTAQEFHEAVLSLLTNKKLHNHLVENGHQFVKTFDWKFIGNEMTKQLSKLF